LLGKKLKYSSKSLSKNKPLASETRSNIESNEKTGSNAETETKPETGSNIEPRSNTKTGLKQTQDQK